MITGLIYSFYFSHQRTWAILRINENGHTVLKVGGTSNKNQVAFGKAFQAIGAKWVVLVSHGPE
jgi:cytochrome c biogenesis protein ResB